MRQSERGRGVAGERDFFISYTAVNRRITEGRRALRKLEREREDACDSR